MSRFCFEIFCLTVPKSFVGEPFYAVFQKISGSQKVYGWERGGIMIFRRKNFCLAVPKIFVGEPLSISLIAGIEKCYG